MGTRLLPLPRTDDPTRSTGPGNNPRTRRAPPVAPARPPSVAPGRRHDAEALEHAAPLEVLLVEDHDDIRAWLECALRGAGYRVAAAADGAVAQELLAARRFDVVATDVRLPRVDGLALLRHVRRESPDTDVILMTAYAQVPDAIAALRDGAVDYLVKPFTLDELARPFARIAQRRALRSAVLEARARTDVGAAPALVGRSPAMLRVLDRVATLAPSAAPVLITGESGTGKELVARLLHAQSPRHAGPFVVVNCAAFPEALLEAELFGHERGAFTGATRRRRGRFRSAEGGTLLLDEVAEMPPAAQAKLLRVLQEFAVEPLGSDTPEPLDVRLLAATHQDLRELTRRGRFREDLYYRLNVLTVTVPPLRERRGDLLQLCGHFLRQFAPARARPAVIAPRAWAALGQHPFPGNVRELAHAIEHAVLLARGDEIDVQHLPAEIAGDAAAGPGAATFRPLDVALGEFEREYLVRALRLAGGKRAHAAELLGISRHNLWEKLRRHDLARWSPDE